MKSITRSLFYLSCAGILLFSSCNKLEMDKIALDAWNPNFAVPIAHSNFSASDILASTDSSDLVVVNPNSGAIALVYKTEIYSFGANSILELQNVNDSKTLGFSELNIFTIPSFNATITSNNEEYITFNAGGAELH